MASSLHLLIVDDEPDIQKLILRYFSKQGFTVQCAGSGKQMHEQLQTRDFDIILLDVCLPDISGFDLLLQIKAQTQSAVIMLTGQARTEQRVAGLNQGADDYLPKPFDLAELHARITAVLRRQSTDEEPVAVFYRYLFAGYTLETSTHALRDKHSHKVKLTPAEYALLLAMLKNAGVVLSRDYLLLTTRGRQANVNDRAIDVRLSQLRKKLPVENRSTPLFTTIRGGGYMLDCEVEVITNSSSQ